MATGKLNRFWTLIIILLIVITVTGGIAAWIRFGPSQPVEISIPQGEEWQGRIFIGGTVTNPGFYPFTSEDNIGSLIQAAGGTTGSANLSDIKVYVPEVGEEAGPQKVDINRAETWLLKALPGIGETLAQRIIDHRQQNGPFLNTRQLLEIAGIGNTTYEQIKDLITVAE